MVASATPSETNNYSQSAAGIRGSISKEMMMNVEIFRGLEEHTHSDVLAQREVLIAIAYPLHIIS